jgi:DNA-binding NtrC family response regulator
MDPPKYILITDDDERFQSVTATMLQRAGYACDSALDATAALKLLKEKTYDLILADIKMPGNMNMEFIRELPMIAKDVPIIIVTGYPSLQSAMQAIGLSVKGYLVKPFDYHMLLSQVRAWIEHSQAIRERQRLEEEKTRLIQDLQEALHKVKTLSGLLPICAACKKIRDDSGYWHQVEEYIAQHADVEFSHGLCPECVQRYYADQVKEE